MEEGFRAGEIVQLKSGSQLMTIHEVSEDGFYATCLWMLSDGKMQKCIIRLAALERTKGHFVNVVMEDVDGYSLPKLFHRGCVDERDAIETSGTVMPDGTPAREGTKCHRCGKVLEWRDA